MNKRIISKNEFEHKTIDKLLGIRGALDKIHKGEVSPDTYSDFITDLKFLFQDYLETLQKFKEKISLPLQYDSEFVDEAYKKSFFDWNDFKEFKKYDQWFCGLD